MNLRHLLARVSLGIKTYLDEEARWKREAEERAAENSPEARLAALEDRVACLERTRDHNRYLPKEGDPWRECICPPCLASVHQPTEVCDWCTERGCL